MSYQDIRKQIAYSGHIMRETAKAIFFSTGEVEGWLPKSLIGMKFPKRRKNARRNKHPAVTVTMPHWLARGNLQKVRHE